MSEEYATKSDDKATFIVLLIGMMAVTLFLGLKLVSQDYRIKALETKLEIKTP